MKPILPTKPLPMVTKTPLLKEEKQGNVSEYKQDVSQLIVEHRKSGENAPFFTPNCIHFVHGHK